MADDFHSFFERLSQLEAVPELQTKVVDYIATRGITDPKAMLAIIDNAAAGEELGHTTAREPLKPDAPAKKSPYYAPDALPELTAPVFETAPAVAASVVPAEEAAKPAVISGDELANVTNIINQYSGYPGIQRAFASIITANADNPERLSALMRELVDQIEQVRSNPHMRQPVNAEIAAAVEEIREVELQKPDPLNLLRPPEPAPAATTSTPEAKSFTISDVFLVTVGLLGAPAAAERALEQQQQQAQPQGFGFLDLGNSTAAVAAGFPPQSLPNLIGASRDQTFSLI